MTIKPEIQRLAEEAWRGFAATQAFNTQDFTFHVRKAIIAGIELALKQEATEGMRRRGNEALGLERPIRPSQVFRAMRAVQLSEFREEFQEETSGT